MPCNIVSLTSSFDTEELGLSMQAMGYTDATLATLKASAMELTQTQVRPRQCKLLQLAKRENTASSQAAKTLTL